MGGVRASLRTVIWTGGGTGRRPLMNGTKGAVSSVRRFLAMMTHLARAV